MLIKSMAGDFEISISGFEVEDGHLVMVGTMGVWDARTYMTARELLGVFAKLLRPRVLLYLARMPFLLITGGPAKAPTNDSVGREQ